MLNSQYILGDHNYGIEFYKRLKKTSEISSFLKLESKKNFFPLTVS